MQITKMTMKKDKAFVFIVNKSYLFALGTTIINLQKTGNDFYDQIVIYYDGLDDSDIQQIKSIESKTTFIKYDLAAWEKEHIKITTPNAKSFLDRYSHLAWSKYKIIEQLNNFNKVLYLDVDILIRSNLKEVFDVNGLAWRSGNNFGHKFGNKQKKSLFLDTLKNIPNTTPTPNGGLLYASNMNTSEIQKNLNDARQFLIEYLDEYNAGLDELVFGWIAYKNNIPLTQLDPFTYNSFPQMLKQQTKIIHFMGAEKPWNSDLMQTIFPEWLQYYKAWEAVSKISDKKVIEHNNPGAFIASVLNQRRWLVFLKNQNFSFPAELKVSHDLTKEWLILNYNSYAYYEFKLHQYAPGFQIGFWIKNPLIANDVNLINQIEKLCNSKIFNYTSDTRGIYISTNRYPEKDIKAIFEYFYEQTISLLQS